MDELLIDEFIKFISLDECFDIILQLLEINFKDIMLFRNIGENVFKVFRLDKLIPSLQMKVIQLFS
jgi:hypothetical protein